MSSSVSSRSSNESEGENPAKKDDPSEWKETWKQTTLGVLGTEDTRHMMVILHKPADALEALLTHYPHIVYFGYVFWRNLLVRGWLSHQRRDLDRFVDVMPSELQPEQLGVFGNLDAFSRKFLPQRFLQLKIPLTPDNCDDMVFFANARAEDVANTQMKRDSDCADDVGNFVLGSMRAQQMDVVGALITSMSLDLRALWECGDSRGWIVGKQTILHIALSSLAAPAYCTVAPLLLTKFSDRLNPAAPNGSDVLPLAKAAVHGHAHVVPLLVQLGADPNGKESSDPMAPLHYAAVHDRVEFIRKLLEQPGADVTGGVAARPEKDGGMHPIHEAARCDRVNAVKLFVEEYGVDLHIKDSSGTTPIEKAKDCGCHKVVKYLQALVSDRAPRDDEAQRRKAEEELDRRIEEELDRRIELDHLVAMQQQEAGKKRDDGNSKMPF